jgi:hypothetical protein
VIYRFVIAGLEVIAVGSPFILAPTLLVLGAALFAGILLAALAGDLAAIESYRISRSDAAGS